MGRFSYDLEMKTREQNFAPSEKSVLMLAWGRGTWEVSQKHTQLGEQLRSQTKIVGTLPLDAVFFFFLLLLLFLPMPNVVYRCELTKS